MAARSAESGEGTPTHLLLVEDDPSLGELLRRGLDANGYNVHWERDGDAGLDSAGSGAYDLIVLDLMLPGLDGLEVLAALRGEGIRTPVLCLTARAEVTDRVRGLDAGADDYLTKPFAFDELLARLRALRRRPSDVMRTTGLSAGNLRLDPEAHTVTVAERLVDVPPREFDLLEYLLRNRGRALTRQLILDRIWGPDAEPRGNVADATVSRLRRRLARLGWDGSVVPVPGVGYRLNEETEERGP